MTPEERAHLETLLRNHRNRMRELEKQGSFGGTATPPQITIEIEDIKSKILEIDLLLLPKVNMYNRAVGRQSDALECYDIDLTSFFPVKHDDRLDEDAFPSEEIWSEHIRDYHDLSLRIDSGASECHKL